MTQSEKFAKLPNGLYNVKINGQTKTFEKTGYKMQSMDNADAFNVREIFKIQRQFEYLGPIEQHISENGSYKR